MAKEAKMSSGRIVQIIGAVIDVEFERDNVPQVYDALSVALCTGTKPPSGARSLSCVCIVSTCIVVLYRYR